MKLSSQIQLATVFAMFVLAQSVLASETNLTVALSLLQKKSELLAGEARGICYSGFRTGQYPDRGNGAVNPTEGQILEDLNILARHGEFPLIRLYDAKTNSAVVLKLIQQHCGIAAGG